jgi:5-methyltetrahydropteroyltriglutamate--homocysteine methyltransferase
VQLDEPYLQANAAAARGFAVEAIDRALAGLAATSATTVLHTCYGYAVYVSEKRGGYAVLAELAGTDADQLAVEFAQPRLPASLLAPVAHKTIVLGVLDLSTPEAEPPTVIADRLRAALEFVPPERLVAAPDCGMKFLPRRAAIAKLTAMVEGAALVRAEL